jgi:hypothetical protein
MIRAIRILPLAAALVLAAVPAAAQPVAGAFEVPVGRWEYRWVTRADGRGNVTHEPATGSLDLRPNGTHTHVRNAEGERMSTTGAYRVQGALLYLPHVNMDNGRMAQDTFAARHIGDRLYLFAQHGEATLEYTLAPPGAPAEPEVVPGLISSIGGFMQSVLFFESDGGVMPRAQRRYATEFDADSARYINVQIDMSHPITLEDRSLPVSCPFLDENGDVAVTLEWTTEIKRGNASSGASTGIGSLDGGWPRGTYTVRCTVDGVEAPVASFVVR